MNMRQVVRIAIFGALWGVMEMVVGSAFHRGQVPFFGTWLTAIGVGIALVGASFVRRPGALIAIGVIAALLKLISPGGGPLIPPMVAIFLESVLAEIGLALFRYKPSAVSFAVAMVLAMLLDVGFPVLAALMMGGSPAQRWSGTIAQSAKQFHIAPDAVFAVLGALILMRVVVGAIAGLIAWSIAQAVTRRTETAEA